MFDNVKSLIVFSLISFLMIGCSSSVEESYVFEDEKEIGLVSSRQLVQTIEEWEPSKKVFYVYFNWFPENKAIPTREDILKVSNEWSPLGQVLFIETKVLELSDVRISFYGYTWSKIAAEGKDINPTMELNCLEGSRNISKKNRANILHEFGHVLGFVHGHQLRTAPIISFSPEYLKKIKNELGKDWVVKNYTSKYIPMKSLEQEYDYSSIMNYQLLKKNIEVGSGTRRNYELSSMDKFLAAKIYSNKPQKTP